MLSCATICMTWHRNSARALDIATHFRMKISAMRSYAKPGNTMSSWRPSRSQFCEKEKVSRQRCTWLRTTRFRSIFQDCLSDFTSPPRAAANQRNKGNMHDQNRKIFLKYYAGFVGISLLVVTSSVVLLLKQVISPRFMGVILLIYLATSFFLLNTTLKKKYE